jgi:uncharacterized HAD superfamily protein
MKKLLKNEATALDYTKHCFKKWIDSRSIFTEALLTKIATLTEEGFYEFPDEYSDIFKSMDKVFGVA